MEWEDDDFENQLAEYSEIETVTRDQPTPPITILQYNKRIKSNNNISIFDADYSLDEPNGHNSAVRNSKNEDNLDLDHEDLGVFKDEKVTFVLSGRGRGGRNQIFKPGDAQSNKTFNEDDEIRKEIRKVAPMGYSNEITESLYKAQQKSRLLEQNGVENITPNKSMINSPCLSKSSSPLPTKLTSEKITSSPLHPGNKKVLNNHSPILSEKSTSHTTSDPYSSEYFTSNEQNMSPSSSNSTPPSTSNSTPKTASDENLEDYAEKDCSTVPLNKSEVDLDTNRGAIPKRPVPLSVMLQRSREEHRRKHLKAQSDANELASQRKILEIIRQDMEAERRRKMLAENSSASSSSSWDDQPSWRQRNNSPPRYAWGQMSKRREPRELNINSFDDFPSLK